MGPNITYDVTHVRRKDLQVYGLIFRASFFTTCRPTDRAIVFCMSVPTTEELYSDFKTDHDRIYFYHGKLAAEDKARVFSKYEG
ncbi:hypothetical protein V1509DRAFT_636458 [Lipomyces kononenkoae]